MKKLLLLLLFCALSTIAADVAIEKWQGEAFKLDGKLTESAWKKGQSFSDFSPFASERRLKVLYFFMNIDGSARRKP